MTQLLLRVTVDNSDPMIMFTNLMRYSRHVNLRKAQISQSAAFFRFYLNAALLLSCCQEALIIGELIVEFFETFYSTNHLKGKSIQENQIQ